MRRVESASFISQPKLRVPKAARQRRRRNNRRIHFPLATVKGIIFSSRWISLALLAFVIFAIYLVGADEQFYLTTIPVDGTTTIPASEVVAASHLAGMHIFATDPNDAAENIMAVSGIISATVTLHWPNQVNIKVEEDTPIALWLENGNQFWVTHNGGLMEARANVPGMLVIESEIPAAVATESAEDADAAAETEPVAQVAFVPPEALAGALQLQQLRPNIERLFYQPGNGLSYQDGRGWRAYFGTGTDMKQKLVVYETIVEDLLAKGITPAYISVANQERPFYRGQ